MKVLTLTQPYATLMALGAKRVETRGWSTAYRGPIAIHAGKGFPREFQWLCGEPPFRQVLTRAGFDTVGDLPRGEVLAVVELVDCVRVERRGGSRTWPGTFPETMPETPWERLFRTREGWAEHDLEFGNYEEGRFAWLTRGLRTVTPPVPLVGALGLRELAPAKAALVEERTRGPAPGATP